MEEEQLLPKTCPEQLALSHLTEDPHPFPNSDLGRDLALAARLGGELLDRNNELEQALEKSRRDIEEKDFEIKLLLQRISELNELSQRKCMLADEADSNSTELCQLNRLLSAEMEADKKKIGRLSARIAELERQVNDLWDRIEGCTCNNYQRSRSPSRHTMEKSGPCVIRSLSPNPICDLNLKESNTGTSTHHSRSTTVRCLFIDDELVDQPLLGTCTDNSSFCYENKSDKCDQSKNVDTSSHMFTFRRTRSFTHLPAQCATFTSRKRSKYPDKLSVSLVAATSSTVGQPRHALSTCQSSQVQHPDCPAYSGVGSHGWDIDPLSRSETCCRTHPDFQLSEDYQPQYKQLFRDTFFFLRSLKSAKSISPSSSLPADSSHAPRI